MKLIREDIEDFEVITEAAADGKKTHYIQGIFMQSEAVNRNGRMYPFQTMQNAVNKYNEDFVIKNRAVGTLGHEDSPRISEDKISHIITKLYFEGNDVFGKAKVLDTKHGKELQALINGGVSFGCSSRALGSLKEQNGIKVVQGDFLISCIDAVLQPSAHDAWVNGILENAEWLYSEDKKWVPRFVEESQKIIHNTTQKDIEEVALQIFSNYMKELQK